jgi:hypothetical protein
MSGATPDTASQRLIETLKGLPRTTLAALAVLALCGLGLGLLLPYLGGQLDDLQRSLRSLRAQTAQTRALTVKTRQDVAFAREHMDAYRAALAQGLFAEQNRLEATQILDTLYHEDYLAGLTYEFASQTTRPAGPHTVVVTPLRLSVDVMLDRDIYVFMRDIEDRFPGRLVLTDMRILPQTPVTPSLLAAIRGGRPATVFRADLTYAWTAARRATASTGGNGENDGADEEGIE